MEIGTNLRVSLVAFALTIIGILILVLRAIKDLYKELDYVGFACIGFAGALATIWIILSLIDLIIRCCSPKQESEDAQIKSWLAEVVPCINQGSTGQTIQSMCERVLKKWHLPLNKYNYHDAAFLLYHLYERHHRFEYWSSVANAAQNLCMSGEELIPQLLGKPKLTRQFKKILRRIRSNHRPRDNSPEANVYVLLKRMSRNSEATDYSPKSNICSDDIMPFHTIVLDRASPHARITTSALSDGACCTPNLPTDDYLPTYTQATTDNDLPTYEQAVAILLKKDTTIIHM